jgi:hypothetical protein
MDLWHKTCHPRATLSMAQNETSAVGQTGERTRNPHFQREVAQLMPKTVAVGHIVSNSLESFSRESRGDARAGEFVPCHECLTPMSGSDTCHYHGNTMTTYRSMHHGINGLGALPEQSNQVVCWLHFRKTLRNRGGFGKNRRHS